MSHPQRPSLFRRLLSSLPRRRQAAQHRLRQRRLAAAERLENRALLATITWNNASGGNWNVGSNWVGGVAPGINDDAFIPNFAGSPTITFSSGSAAVKSLTSNETVVVSGGTFTATTISQVAGSFNVTGGTLGTATLATGSANISGAVTLGNFAVASGASLSVASGASVQVLSAGLLSVTGNMSFATGSSLTLVQQSTGGTTSQLVINDTGVVTLAGATVGRTGLASTRTFTDIRNGGRLLATDSTFAMGSLFVGSNVVINSGDWARNRFDTAIYMPHHLINMLSAAGGGSDNVRFGDIIINSTALNSGSLDLRAIGTETTANLDYVFFQNFTIANGATLNVSPTVRTWTETATVLSVSGTANFGSGSSLTIVQQSTGGTASQLLINDTGVVTLAGATVGRTGLASTRTFIDIRNGGRLLATDSTFAMGSLFVGSNVVINSGDWARNRFDTAIYMPHHLVNMLSAAGGGSDNVRFGDIIINSTALNSGSLDLRAIGTETTADLDYVFFYDFTVANGASLNVSPNVRTWTEAGRILNVFGTANFATGSSLTLVQQSSSGTLSQLLINDLAVVTMTGTTVARSGVSSVNTKIDIRNGGRLLATDSTFAMGSLFVGSNVVINSGDWARNRFDTAIYMPHHLVNMLSAAGGGSDNVRFADIIITSTALNSGSLDLRAIGTETTANLDYVFFYDFTIANGASLNVSPNVRTWTEASRTLSVFGTANFATGSSLTLVQQSSSGTPSQLLINDLGFVDMNGTTVSRAGVASNNTKIDIKNGGRLRASDSTFVMGSLVVGSNVVINSADWARNRFDTPIYMPHHLVNMLSAAGGGSDNVRFGDIIITSTALTSGSLDLRAIGTETTANLDYVFFQNFTIANGAALNVSPSVRTWTETATVLSVSGTANFGSGSSLTIVQQSSSGTPSQLLINDQGTVTMAGTTVIRSGLSASRTLIDVKNGGSFFLVDSSVDIGTYSFAANATVRFSQQGTNKYFRTSSAALALSNYRSIDLAYGSTFNLSQPLQVGNSITDTASVKTSYSSTLALASHLTGKTRTPANFTPQGRTLFNSGVIGVAQTLEIMGADVGASSAGYSNNFAYGKVELAANTLVRLTNTDVNWNDSRAEALYVNTLIVGSGAKLDLNGLKLYVRAYQNFGTIVNGTVNTLPTLVPDGGPLAFATPTPGTIDAGATDTWTFTTVRTGPVMIQLNPGSGGVTAATAPVLRRVRIELLTASDALLKVIENDADGNIVTLDSDVLASGQNFKIRVKAHSGFPAFTGNYVITLIDAAASETALTIAPDSTSASKSEGNAGATSFTYNVSRFGDLSSTASVAWSVTGTGINPANAADFVGGVLPSGIVNFTTTTDITKAITINVAADSNFENDEGFTVTLSNPSNRMTITQGTANSVILNDDQPINPDLIISSIAPPVGAKAGQRVNLSWTEKNIGAGTASGDWTTSIQAVNRATGQVVYDFSPRFQSNSLASNASIDRSIQFDMPDGAAGEGIYDVTIAVDAGRNVAETNTSDTGETNNSSTANFSVGPGVYPDLSISEIVAPSTIELTVPFTISWRVTNSGSALLTKTIRDQIYLSTDGVIDASDRILGTLDTASKTPVAIGANYTQSLDVTLPLDSSLPAGNYQLLVATDFANEQFELSETNNRLARGIGVTLPPITDLIVSSIQTRDLVVAGQTVPVTWIVKNQGTAPATGSWTDRVWLSADATIGNDVAVGSFPITTTILPDGSVERTQEIAIPAGLSGAYRFVVTTDLFNQVLEFNREDNNVAIDNVAITIDSRPSPNLVIDSVTGLTSNLFSGQPATVEWVVRNIGNASTNSSFWEDRVYLSNDAEFSTDDFLLGRVPNPSYLNSGDVYRSSLTASLPEDAVGGRYFIVVTDATKVVSETAGETDNTRSSALAQITLTPPADLFVTSVVAPRDAFEGEPIIISWIVKNQGTGPTRVNQWVDQVYLSLDGRDIGPGDSLLATVTHDGTLAVNEDYRQISYSVLLPENRVGDDAYIIVRTDASRKVYEHSFEGNNDTSTEFATRIIARPKPDLIVDSISVPNNATAGQPLAISFTVTNPTGTATRQSLWQDSVYLSTDNQLSLQNDLLLGSRSRSGVLQAGQSETRNLNFSLPNTLSGSYYVIVVTDSGQQVQEASDDNNTSSSTNSVSVVINPPDLEPTSLSISGLPLAGRQVTVNYSVTNKGGSPTPISQWSDAIYLSSDNQWDAGDRLLSQRTRSGVLAAGANETRAVDVRLPADFVGNTHLIVRSDSGDQVYELNNDNNARALAIVVGDDRPDLTVTSFQPLLGSGELLPGSTLTFDFEVSNRGAGPTYGQSWVDRLVMSADTILGNGDDILLAAYNRPRELLAGQSYARVSENVLIPAATPLGVYRLFMTTDAARQIGEPIETNNTLTSAEFRVTNAPGDDGPWADLTITAVTVPATLVSGNNLPISWTVRNTNFVSTSSSIWYDDVWLSQDTTIDSSDISIGRYLRNTALASNQQYTRTINYPVGIDMEGTYYTIVSTDATNRVREGIGETNNLQFSASPTAITLSPVPDLRVSTVAPPTTAFSGRGMPLSWTVENAGGRSATGPWLDRAYLSLDQIYDPSSDLPLGFVERSAALASGANYNVTTNLNVPTGIGGNYYVIVVTDSSNRVYERSLESNNFTVSSQPVTIAHLPPADLVVGDITIPVNGELNQNATINFTVTNNGAFPARGGWFDSIYFSSDDTWDINDGYLGRVQRTADVAAGASYNATLTAPLPGVLPGNYKVIIRSDIRNNVVEANETNNLKGTLNSVSLDAPALTLGVARNGTITKGAAVYYKVTVPAGETVAIEFDGLATTGATELYSSFDAMPRRSQADHVSLQPYNVDQRIVISSTLGGTYYILAVAQDIASSPSNYSIIARIVPFSVFDTGYGQGGTAGSRTIAINGAKFDRSVTAELVDSSGQATPAVRYYRTSDTQLYATFDLQTLARGNYSVRLSKASTSENVVVNNALQVVFATASQDPLSLTRPDSFNRRRDDRPPAIIPVSLGWRNTTLNDVPVPLIHFSATDPFASTLEDAKAGRTINSTEFLGFQTSDGPREILMPGEFASADFFIVPRQVAADSPPIDIHYVAEYFYGIADAGYPWDFDLSQLDMSNLSDDQAITTIAAFRQFYGSSISTYRAALTETLQRAGAATPAGVADANRYLLQELFDRFVASRETSLVGHLSFNDAKVDFEDLVITLSEVGGTRTYSSRVWQDGSFVLATLPAAQYSVRVTGGPVKAADGLTVQLAADDHADLTVQLVAAAATEADSVSTRNSVGTSPIAAPHLTRAGKVNESMSGNVLDEVMSQLTGISYRVELVGDAPIGFTLRPDGSYSYLSSQTTAFVVHYDLVLPDVQTRSARLFEGEIRSRGALAITLKNNFTRDVRSLDPNDIVGPAGYGDQKWVSANDRLQYKIRFENNPEQASSAAGLVTIEQTLDSDLDPTTVEFGSFMFGGREFTVPAKSQSLNRELDLRTELGIYVRVFAFVDVASGKLSWTFSSISPDTGTDITDPSQGFLPLNEQPPEGDGSVSYSVKAKRSATTGAMIDAQARIIFDGNAAIDTPSIFNTLDATRPVSTIASTEFIAANSRIQVAWDGEDGEGAGLSTFDVYVSTNGGSYRLWLKDTQLTESQYDAVTAWNYSFVTIARDNVGNAEPDSKLPDAARPVATIVGTYQLREGIATRLTGRGEDPDGVLTSFIYEWDFDYDGGAFDVNATSATPDLLIDDGPATRTVALRVKGIAAEAAYSLITTSVVTVENAPPNLTRQSASATAFVNTELRNSGSWQDSLGDTVTLSASLGSVVQRPDGTWSWTFVSATPRADETVTITATDEDNATSSVTFTITSAFNSATFLPQLRSPASGLTNVRSYTLQLDFGSPVINFSLDDLQLVNATASNLIDAGNGLFNFQIEAIASGAVSVALLANRVLDGQGRSNQATEAVSWQYVDSSNMDFGDAPNSASSGFPQNYPTLLADDGARHTPSSLLLGVKVDIEADGQPANRAEGDDTNGAGGDDEDGIAFTQPILSSSFTSTISSWMATASAAGKLDGWIDFNRDGDWNDAGEQIATSVQVIAGVNLLSFTVPQGAFVGDTYARFRISTQGNLSPTGAADDGEVEDHVVTIGSVESQADLVINSQLVGAHRLEVIDNQLTLTANSRIFFQAIASSIRRVSYVNGATEVYAFAAPATSLFGALIFVAPDQAITLQTTRTAIDLSSFGDQISGVNRIELTSDNAQELRFNSAAVKRLNTDGRLQVITGVADTVPVGRDWKYSQTRAESSNLIHRFATNDGATIDLFHARQWQNALNTNDVSGNGTVEPRDALLVINQINIRSGLPQFNPADPTDFFFADTSGDGTLSPIDALLIINQINIAAAGEGEENHVDDQAAAAVNRPIAPAMVDSLIGEFEIWSSDSPTRRRRR